MALTTARRIALLRLVSQSLIASDCESPVQTVRRLLALQAQDFGASLWALGARVPGAVVEDVFSAIDDGLIVRSWPMRGTLHFLAAEDLRWMLDVTSARTLKGVVSRQARLALDDDMLDAAHDVAVELLRGGKSATREQFVAALSDAGVTADSYLSYHIIWFLAHRSLICWGPMAGSKQALVLCDEWLPKTPLLSRDEALAQFLSRYLEGHGPATLKDFAWWNKVTVADAKRALEATRDSLVEISHNNTSYWIPETQLERGKTLLGDANKAVLALPAFDEYLLGYQDRELVLHPDFANRIVPGNNGIFLPTIVANGDVVGTWKRTNSKSSTKVESYPFTKLSAAQSRQFNAAVDRCAEFLGKPISA